MTDFYSRDRNKAFDELKEELYNRRSSVLESIEENDAYIPWDDWNISRDTSLVEELEWLNSVLDKIERS